MLKNVSYIFIRWNQTKDLIRAWRVARFPFFLGVDNVGVAADVAQDPIHTEQTFARTKLLRFHFE